jgi:hypothetical protein
MPYRPMIGVDDAPCTNYELKRTKSMRHPPDLLMSTMSGLPQTRAKGGFRLATS